VLISRGIWRRILRYLPPQPPSPPNLLISLLFPFSLSPSLHVSGGCFHHAACVARFVKDVAASCLFHGRLPTSPHIFRPLSFPRFISISLYFSPPPTVYLLMNSVSRACFCFPAWSQGGYVFFLFRRGWEVMEPSLAHWCSGTKVGQGTEWPGRQTGCGRLTMPALQSVSSVLSANRLSISLSVWLRLPLFSAPKKVRRAWADKKSFISHLNNENPNRSADSVPPSSFSTRPSNIFSAWQQSCYGAFAPD